MSRIASLCDWLLRSPIIWGAVAWLLFDTAVQNNGGAWLNSYFTETKVHRITAAVFFVGMAALFLRGIGVLGQFSVFRRRLIDPATPGGQPVEDAAALIEQLDGQPSWLKSTYLTRRLHAALEYVQRRGSADALESRLRSLEDDDYGRMSSGYSMVRVITAVVPLLGFLGTVLGIATAVSGLSPSVEELEASIGGVTNGLGEAFSTTALALALSIVLVFAKLVVERNEEHLLAMTSERVYRELIGRFEQYGAATDPNVASIHRMCEQVVRATEVMSARQAELWKSTIDETNEQWSLASQSAGQRLTDAVATGLRTSLKDHATGLTEGVEHQLSKLNASLGDQAAALATSVSGQVEAVRDGLREQSQQLADAVQGHVSVLSEVVARHGERLDTGATELLGNLRTGLERMAELLVEALQKHGETLTQAEQELATENRRHLSEVEAALGEAMVLSADRQEKLIGSSEAILRNMQESVSESASVTIAHQEQLVKQGEVLMKVVEATGQVEALQSALNKNLDALSRGQSLEETLMSLAASIQLLSARTGRPANESGSSTSQAA